MSRLLKTLPKVQKISGRTLEGTDKMCVILIFKAWRQYRKIERWQKDQEAMWKLEKAREENAEEERQKYEKEKRWEGWKGCDWSKVN